MCLKLEIGNVFLYLTQPATFATSVKVHKINSGWHPALVNTPILEQHLQFSVFSESRALRFIQFCPSVKSELPSISKINHLGAMIVSIICTYLSLFSKNLFLP